MILQHGNTSDLLFSASGSHPDSFPYFFPVIWLGILAGSLYVAHLRKEAMRDLASRRGLRFLGRRLPREYVGRLLPGTSFLRFPRNVIFGEMDGELVLAFDVTTYGNRNSRSMTYVARRWNTPPQKALLDDNLTYREVARWRVVHVDYSGFFEHPRKMNVQEIEDVWEQLRNRPEALSSNVNLLIHPRRRQVRNV